MIEFIDVTDETGVVVETGWLARAETVHRQLRPDLRDYAAVLERVFDGGGRLRLAVDGERVVGVALWRVFENTYAGRQLFVDDLVTDEAARSQGVGGALLESLVASGRELNCDTLALDSGVERTRAHAFYEREGMRFSSRHFVKRIGRER